MKKILIFTAATSGHNMEYLHHIYDVAAQHTDRQYVFVVPESFEQVKHNFAWEPVDHIVFDFITDAESASYKDKGMLASSYHLCKLVRRRIKKHKADKLFVITLMSHLPFAPFMYGWHVKMSGIVYKIYLYEWHNSSFAAKAMNVLKYILMRVFPLFERIYILNDEASTKKLNACYKTKKFCYLPDPYVPIATSGSDLNLRKTLNVASDQTMFVHFGALAERKGTMHIIDSLQHLSDEDAKKYVFVFAGKVFPDIKEAFYAGVKKYQHKVQIYVKDEFCSFEYLAALCEASDAILIPYLETAQSSGVIGYAAQFGKPVIAPNEGMIGELVKRYDLGVADCIKPGSLVDQYRKIANKQIAAPTLDYCRDHQIGRFQQVVTL